MRGMSHLRQLFIAGNLHRSGAWDYFLYFLNLDFRILRIFFFVHSNIDWKSISGGAQIPFYPLDYIVILIFLLISCIILLTR